MLPQKQLSAWIQRSQKILLTTGDKFTGDGVCAMLALQMLLTRLGKKVAAIKPVAVCPKYNFLKGVDLIKRELEEKGDLVISIAKGKEDIDNIEYIIEENSTDIIVSPKNGHISTDDISFRKTLNQFDLVIVLNTPNLEGLEDIFRNNTEFFAAAPIANISACSSNEFFGKINMVDIAKSSTCELISQWLLNEAEFSKFFDVDLATILLAGIISTTESFLEPATTANALEVAGALQKIGAKHSDIIEHLFKMKTLPALKIWGTILNNLEFDPVHHISWANVSHNDFCAAKAAPEDVTDLTNGLLRHVKGSDLIVVFLETSKEILVKIRVSSSSGPNTQQLKEIFDGEIVLNGIDYKIPNTSLAKAEMDVLPRLAELQKNRIPNLSEDQGIEKFEIKVNQEEVEKEVFPMAKNTAQGSQESVPKAPEEVPFRIDQKDN